MDEHVMKSDHKLVVYIYICMRAQNGMTALTFVLSNWNSRGQSCHPDIVALLTTMSDVPPASAETVNSWHAQLL